MPELSWGGDADTLLRDVYGAYRETGVLAVDVGAAAGLNQPGVFVLAALLGDVTGSTSPYPGLALAMALLVAIPMVWLPTSVARIFTRARAGYALILLPALLWLLNQGTILAGTQYGLSDSVSVLRVHAYYGVPASLAFALLALILHLSTFRLGWRGLLVATALLGVGAGFLELTAPFAGYGVAASIGVLWWLNMPSRRRWLLAFAASAVAVFLCAGVHAAAGAAMQPERTDMSASASVPAVRSSGGIWEVLYVGLAYPEPITGAGSALGIEGSAEAVREAVADVDAGAREGTVEYEDALRELYSEAASADPMQTAGLYLAKLLYVVKYFGAMIAFILVGYVIALMRRSPQRRLMGVSLVIALPALLIGLAAPVIGTPDLYQFTILAAALGLLVAVALGGLVWSLTSMPSHVRATERNRLSSRVPKLPPTDVRSHTSVIIPTRNGADVIASTVLAVSERLHDGDEVIVVENGSTDDTTSVLERLAGDWTGTCSLVVLHSAPGLGEALRTGVLASSGQWLLLTADDLPFDFTDLDQFAQLPADTVVAIGSKAHPGSDVVRSPRRMIQSRIFRFLRAGLLQSAVGDSQGTIWADGEWARPFALVSRETGLMWTTELVLAAEQQAVVVREVPVTLAETHESGSSRFRLADAWASVVGFTRLAVYKDDYVNEVWTRTPAETAVASTVESAGGRTTSGMDGGAAW